MKRRFFLQGFGGAAVAAPFLTSLMGRGAFAQTATAGMGANGFPVRNILFYMHNGVNTTRWFLDKEDGPITAADLSPTLAEPLADFVDQLLIIRGFKSLNGYGAGQTIDPHNQAMGSKLTCAPIQDGMSTDNYAKGISVDQEMAKQMNPGGVPPLTLSVGQPSNSIKEVISFSAPETAQANEVNPFAVYSQLTDVLSSAPAPDTGGTPAPVTEADYSVLQGQSVLDLIRDDLKRYEVSVGSQSDKERVAAWTELLASTEATMMEVGGAMAGSSGAGAAVATASCNTAFAEGTLGVTDETVSEAGTGASGSKSGSFNFNIPSANDESMKLSFTKGGDMMLNFIALNAICDSNRVMSMIYPGYVIFNWDGISHTADHHGLSHRSGDFGVDNSCIPNVMKMIEEIDNWYAGKYAKLVGLLASIPEGDTNLLHNTSTMYLNELSDGDAHNLNDLPIVIAGGAGGTLKQGMAVNVEGKNLGPGVSETGCTLEGGTTSGRTATTGGNVPINKLYCTLMNAYGMTDGGQEWAQWGQGDNDKMNGFSNPGEETSIKA